jgi:Flp pilus assembly pilin Flp
MKKIVLHLCELRDDTSGAAFIEYSVLLGVILAVSIATIAAVGTWSAGRWTTLETNLNPAPAPAPAP